MRLQGRFIRRAVRLVVALCAVALTLSGCSVYDVPLPGGASTGSNPIEVHVEFADVLDLVPQSLVKSNDVNIGKVTAVQVKGYHADVTIQLQNTAKIPDNAIAEIRQTSLLGEKFVSLSPPPTGASSNMLQTGDVIPLSRTGRNPQVEEVLGALSLILNGGGVGQLKTIVNSLNQALGGHESDARNLLSQLRTFMGQLDQNKTQIVQAIDNLDRLAVEVNRQDPAIKSALDNLPSALRSVDSQRAALVRLLQALARLSGVGVRVIRASKADTIATLQALSPVLNQLGKAGQALPDATQVFLTYPFVDAAVGNSPRVARNLHMGDYTNLSVRLAINIPKGLPVKVKLPTRLPKKPKLPHLPKPVQKVCRITKQKVAQVRRAIARSVDSYVNQVNLGGVPLPASLKRQLKSTLRAQLIRRLSADLLSSINCKNPNKTLARIPGLLNKYGPSLVRSLIRQLGRQLSPRQVTKRLCKQGVGSLSPRLGRTCRRLLGGVLSGGGGGGGLPGVKVPNLPGGLLGRTAFGPTSRATVPTIDQVMNGRSGTAEQLGYNSTLAALLLQGVAS